MLNPNQLEMFFRLSSPLLTVYLRTRPVDASLHGPTAAYIPWLKDESRKLAASLSSTEKGAFLKQVERVEEFLRQRRPHERSLVIFAGSNVWETVPLQAEVQNELHWGNAAVSQLIWLASEHKPYGLIVVDQAGARFFYYCLGEIVEDEEKKFAIDISQWKNKELGHVTGQGVRKTRGSQRDVFEKRMDSQYARLCRETAQQAAAFRTRSHLAAVFLVGPERLIKSIQAKVPRSVRQPVVLLDEDLAGVTPLELLKHLEPRIANWEREREAELIAVITKGEEGTITGFDETLAELQKGKIRTVVLATGLDPILHQCVQCGWTDRSADPVCSACGSKRRTVTFRDALPELARRHQTDIEVVSDETAKRMKEADGMAGWLRPAKSAPAEVGAEKN